MSDLKLTTAIDAENPILHDLEIRNGQLQWVGIDLYDAAEQAAMIAQRCRCRLQMMRGEWYQDLRLGVPWRQVMAAKGTTRARMARVIRAALSSVPGVASVGEVTVTQNHVTRTATIAFQVFADTGQVIGPELLDLPFVIRSED